MVELGVFLPVLNNGWIVSTAAPQYQPSYAMNKAMTLLAEDLGFSFALSPVMMLWRSASGARSAMSTRPTPPPWNPPRSSSMCPSCLAARFAAGRCSCS